MIPTRRQWKRWTLPSKYTVLGFLVGLFFGVLSTALSFYFWLNPRSSIEPIALPPPIFRASSVESLSGEEVTAMVRKYDFFVSNRELRTLWSNPEAKGFENRYEIKCREAGLIVVDYASGLVWQRNGANSVKTFSDAKKYISSLNEANFAGYSDWRLPTLEEAMSLMEPQTTGLPQMHIDSVFNLQHWIIWTSDLYDMDRIWVVHFLGGVCKPMWDDIEVWVRAVR